MIWLWSMLKTLYYDMIMIERMFRFKQNELWNENEKHVDGLLGKGSHHVAGDLLYTSFKKRMKTILPILVTRKKKL